MSCVTEYAKGVYGVDANYEGPGLASGFILRSGKETAIIETAHNGSLPYMQRALEELGIKAAEVKFICLTHVHLDHAGGAGSYMRFFPKAKLVVHSRGRRHMADPTKLIEGVRAVYGMEETARLYGEVLPVPEERILSPHDDEVLELGSMRLRVLETPGHAKHHLAFFEETGGTLFAGDAFGVSYSWMRGGSSPWVLPTSSPVQFDPQATRETLARLVALAPKTLLLTHFGALSEKEIPAAGEALSSQTEAAVALTVKEKGKKDKIKEGLIKLYEAEIKAHGITRMPAPLCEALAVDLELNAQGLACWYESSKS